MSTPRSHEENNAEQLTDDTSQRVSNENIDSNNSVVKESFTTDSTRQRAEDVLINLTVVSGGSDDINYVKDTNAIIAYGQREYQRGLQDAAKVIQTEMVVRLVNGEWSEAVLRQVGEIKEKLDALAHDK